MYSKRITALFLSIALCLQPVFPAAAGEITERTEDAAEESASGETAQEEDAVPVEEEGKDTGTYEADGTESTAETEEGQDAAEEVIWEELISEEAPDDGKFAVQSFDASDVTVEVADYEFGPDGEQQEITYSGGRKEPYVDVKAGGKYLKKDRDFTVSYEDNVNAGTAMVHVKGAGDYEFEKDVPFTIKKHTLKQDDVTLILGAYENRYDMHSYGKNSYYVSSGAMIFSEGTDYTVSGDTDLDKSGAEVTITGIGNCEGTVIARFPEYEEMTVSIGGQYVYMCTPKPDVTVKIGDRTLKQGAAEGDGDYYVKTTSTGGRMLKVEVIGSYDGARVYEYSNIRMDKYTITRENAKLEKDAYAYTGSFVKPAVTVTVNGTTLTEDTDYALEYKNNIKPGSASVTVHGCGSFTGEVQLPFTIEKDGEDPVAPEEKPVTVSVIGAGTFTYDGSEKTVDVEVKMGEETVPAENYSVTYKDNVNAGTAAAVIKGAYKGQELKAEKTFTILPKDLTTYIVSVGYAQTESGTEVFCEGKALEQGTDYDISIIVPEDTENGTWTAEIKGKGNYRGTVRKDYKKADIAGGEEEKKEISAIGLHDSYEEFFYKGIAIEPYVIAVYNGELLKQNVDYIVRYTDNVDVGTATITVTGINGYKGTISTNFTIKPREAVPNVKLSASEFVYSGEGQAPSAEIVTVSGVRLTEGRDYTVSVPESVNAGTYRVSVELKGNYSGTGTAEYRILPKKVTPYIALSQKMYVCDGKVKRPSVKVAAEMKSLAPSEYTVTYAAGRRWVGTYGVTVKLRGNYSGTRTVSFIIVPDGTSFRKLTPSKDRTSVTVYWKKQAQQVTGYQIRYSTSPDFSKDAKIVTVSGASKTSAVIRGLKKGKRYYFRIRTYKTVGGKKYYSSWSR